MHILLICQEGMASAKIATYFCIKHEFIPTIMHAAVMETSHISVTVKELDPHTPRN